MKRKILEKVTWILCLLSRITRLSFTRRPLRRLKQISEAVELYFETMNKEEIEEALSKEFLTTTLEVEVG